MTSTLTDADWYLNWASLEPITWPDLHRRACHEAANSWDVYTQAVRERDAGSERAALAAPRLLLTRRAHIHSRSQGINLILGEWSLATNYDAPVDLDDDATVADLRQLFTEQLSVYANAPAVVGAFYWTLRMGSGWDPRPDPKATDPETAGPRGQLAGTSASRSLPDFPFKVWSLLEMGAHGIVSKLDEPLDDACADVPADFVPGVRPPA